jgi:hypothetical protein
VRNESFANISSNAVEDGAHGRELRALPDMRPCGEIAKFFRYATSGKSGNENENSGEFAP